MDKKELIQVYGIINSHTTGCLNKGFVYECGTFFMWICRTDFIFSIFPVMWCFNKNHIEEFVFECIREQTPLLTLIAPNVSP